jgi:hypothetical protein
MAIVMAETLAKSGFQPDHVCVAAEPFSNNEEDSGINLDYIAIKLWSETLNFSFSTMSEVA